MSWHQEETTSVKPVPNPLGNYLLLYCPPSRGAAQRQKKKKNVGPQELNSKTYKMLFSIKIQINKYSKFRGSSVYNVLEFLPFVMAHKKFFVDSTVILR